MSRPPLNSPEFNLREIAKQLVLLEDHLNDDTKFCKDCIRKHLLLIEALAEEAVSLDISKKFINMLKPYPGLARSWMVAFTDGMDKYELSQVVRKHRKVLMNKVYDPRAKTNKRKRG